MSVAKTSMSITKHVQANHDMYYRTIPDTGIQWFFSDVPLELSPFRKLRNDGDNIVPVGEVDGFTLWETSAMLADCIRHYHGNDALLDEVDLID